MKIHVVAKGQTLWSISHIYNTDINQIISVNGLTQPDRLAVGQALVIPTPEVKYYSVRPGDTLWSIAAMFGTTVEALVRANQLNNPNLLYVGQVLRIAKPATEVNGYMTNMGVVGQQITGEIGSYLTYMCTFSYKVLADGNLLVLDDAALLAAQKPYRIIPLLSITNMAGDKFNSDLAHAILSNTYTQDILISNIISIMKSKGYRGLNIDFEYVYQKDRELYNQFLERVVNRLHPEGFSVSTALAPKVRADQTGLLYEAHDYPVHGRLADFVVLMTYEWGWAGGPPLAIAPINEVRRVLDYAVTAIPRNKILMGMPLYGRDWRLPFVYGGPFAEQITPPEAVNRAILYGADIQYDILYQSPFYRYTDRQGTVHEVWFEDARSVLAKYNLVKEYGLRGVSYWELTSIFPQNWPVLAASFEIKKLI